MYMKATSHVTFSKEQTRKWLLCDIVPVYPPKLLQVQYIKYSMYIQLTCSVLLLTLDRSNYSTQWTLTFGNCVEFRKQTGTMPWSKNNLIVVPLTEGS